MWTHTSILKKGKNGLVYVAPHVDDNLIIHNIDATDEAITAIKENGLVLKIMEGLQNYLFCEEKFSTDRDLG